MAVVCKYANQEDLSILIDFINSYNNFKDIFSFIVSDDYIVCGKYENIDIRESTYAKNSQGRLFYDAMWLLEDKKVQSLFSKEQSENTILSFPNFLLNSSTTS